MIRHPKHKGVFYYLLRITVVAVLVFLGFKIPSFYKSFERIDVEKILDKSVLKDKKLAVKVQKLQAGKLSAYFFEEHSNPIVSVSFLFENAGTAHDDEHKQGLARLAAMLLTEGAGEWDSQTFNSLAEENGVKLSFAVSADDLSGTLAFPAANAAVAEQLLVSALTAPRLEDSYLQLAKQQLLTALQKQNENPQQVLNNKFKENIFAGHPYARNALGKAEDIAALTTDEIRKYLQDNLTQENLIVGITGDLTKEQAEVLLQRLFGGLAVSGKTAALPEIDFSAQEAEYDIPRESAQVMTRLAAKGTRRDNVDFYPLYLANYIFGESGLSSRLSKNIREEKGLTYGVYTYLSFQNAAVLIEGGFSATPENFAEAKEMLKTEWLRLGQEGVTEAELAEAKKSLLNSFYLRFANIDEISNMLVSMQKYKLGEDFLDKRNDYIREVQLREVNAAARKYFRTIPDFVNIGNKKVEEK